MPEPLWEGPVVSELPPTNDGALSPSAILRVGEACERFDDAWLAGHSPRLEDFLAGLPRARVNRLAFSSLSEGRPRGHQRPPKKGAPR